MRSTPFVVAFVVWAGLGLASVGMAQTSSGPTIHNVTLHEGAGVLTITGVGFGRELLVTVDGQPVTVLQGGSDTQIGVLAPAALLTTPGTYRLTLVDPVRHVGDAFVVASRAGVFLPGAAVPSATLVPVTGASPAGAGPSISRAIVTGTPLSLSGPSLSFEDSGYPYRTAIGVQALFSNTSGVFNTASGYRALFSNTIGRSNTVSGAYALYKNTEGSYNTASGENALYSNTAGALNTATGDLALSSNTTGIFNTASGALALRSNTTGGRNTGVGANALHSNTTGNSNTALGLDAGQNATTGSYNLFLGADVTGTSADTNTIRIGLPYDGTIGQAQAFIAGIYGTQVSAGLLVVIDRNGRLGTINPQTGWRIPVPLSGSAPSRTLDDATVQQQLAEQRAINAELRARLSRLEALLAPGAGGK